MEIFPNEVLINIFNNLQLSYKIECMLVCRRWGQVLRKDGLLHTISITSFDMLDGFLELFRKQPSRGAQVKQLLLHDCFNRDCDQVIPFHLFPNLELFYLNTPKNHLYMDIHFLGFRGEFQAKIRNCIQHIADYFDSTFIWDLLGSGTCSRLTTIRLNLARNGGKDKFFNLLSNAPALKTLELRIFALGLADFEKIHSNTHCLSSIHLENCSFHSGSFPDDISPAMSMKSISLSFSIRSGTSLLALTKYLAKKYPSLSHFSYPYLYNFPSIIDTISASTSSQIYKEGLSLLLRTFGSQLKLLNYSAIPLGQYFFQELDEYNCQLHALCGSVDSSMSLFIRLFDIIPPNQCRYIQELNLNNLQSIHLKFLSDMVNLRTLTLRFKNSNETTVINLNDILEACSPTLEELEIYRAHLECDDISLPDRQYSINKLKIERSKISSTFDKFIVKSCSDLRFLSLLSCFPCNGMLMLYDHKLICLEINVPLTKVTTQPGACILVKTSNDKKQQFYSVKERKYYKHISEYDPDGYKLLFSKRLKPLSCASQVNQVVSTIVCYSIDHFFINGYTIY